MGLACALGLYLLLSAAATTGRQLQAVNNGITSGVLAYRDHLHQVTTGVCRQGLT